MALGTCNPHEEQHNSTSHSHVQAAQLKSSIWYEWIDSESNPADGLSRDGVEDTWTKKQGWALTDLGSPDWSYVFKSDRWSKTLSSIACL